MGRRFGVSAARNQAGKDTRDVAMDPRGDVEVVWGGIRNLPEVQRVGLGTCLMVSALRKGPEWGWSFIYVYPGLSRRLTARL